MEDERTIYDKFIGNKFVYPVGVDGKPDYGYISVGPREFKIINVVVFNMGDKFVESLELENGFFLRGREITINDNQK